MQMASYHDAYIWLYILMSADKKFDVVFGLSSHLHGFN